jgi:hypothetical protein
MDKQFMYFNQTSTLWCNHKLKYSSFSLNMPQTTTHLLVKTVDCMNFSFLDYC